MRGRKGDPWHALARPARHGSTLAQSLWGSQGMRCSWVREEEGERREGSACTHRHHPSQNTPPKTRPPLRLALRFHPPNTTTTTDRATTTTVATCATLSFHPTARVPCPRTTPTHPFHTDRAFFVLLLLHPQMTQPPPLPPIRFISTRANPSSDNPRTYSFREAVLAGWADDGGMLLPTRLPIITPAQLEAWRGIPYPQLVTHLLALFIDDDDKETVPLEALVQASFAAFASPDVVEFKPLPSFPSTTGRDCTRLPFPPTTHPPIYSKQTPPPPPPSPVRVCT